METCKVWSETQTDEGKQTGVIISHSTEFARIVQPPPPPDPRKRKSLRKSARITQMNEQMNKRDEWITLSSAKAFTFVKGFISNIIN